MFLKVNGVVQRGFLYAVYMSSSLANVNKLHIHSSYQNSQIKIGIILFMKLQTLLKLY